MESDRIIIISVFYGGTWYKGDDDRWQFKNYESKVTDVPKNCSYEQLKDDVYNIVKRGSGEIQFEDEIPLYTKLSTMCSTRN